MSEEVVNDLLEHQIRSLYVQGTRDYHKIKEVIEESVWKTVDGQRRLEIFEAVESEVRAWESEAKQKPLIIRVDVTQIQDDKDMARLLDMEYITRDISPLWIQQVEKKGELVWVIMFDVDKIIRIVDEVIHPLTLIDVVKAPPTWYYDGMGCYQPGGDSKIGMIVEGLFQAYRNTKMSEDWMLAWSTFTLKNSITREVLARVKNKFQVTHADFNLKDEYLNTNDGVLDLEKYRKEWITAEVDEAGSGKHLMPELVPHSHKHRFTYRCPIHYQPKLGTNGMTHASSAIEKFLRSVVKPEDYDLLLDLATYPLVPKYLHKKMIMLIGETDHGKSTFTDFLVDFYGQQNCHGVSLKELTEDNFAAGELFGKLLNVDDDVSSTKIEDVNVFKRLTGNTPVSFARKFMGSVFFTNRAKLFANANDLPRLALAQQQKAFFNRWIFLFFPYRFVSNPATYELDYGEEEEFIRKKDTLVTSRLKDQTERSIFLNLLLVRYPRLFLEGFDVDPRIIEVEWMNRTNDVYFFVTNYCNVGNKIGPEWWVSKDDLQAAYNDACEAGGFKSESKTKLTQSLQQMFKVRSHQKKVDTKRVWGYSPILLKQPTPDSADEVLREPTSPLEKSLQKYTTGQDNWEIAVMDVMKVLRESRESMTNNQILSELESDDGRCLVELLDQMKMDKIITNPEPGYWGIAP